MRRFRRILSTNERELILRTGRIIPTPSGEWLYQPGEVIFLFDLERSDCELLEKIPNAHYQMYGETWILEFSADIETFPDRGGEQWPGAVVFNGAIDLNQIKEVSWTPFDPSARIQVLTRRV
jgi:hypothetical protein